MNTFEELAKKFNGCPLFEGREKGDFDDLVGQTVVIDDYFKLSGDSGAYYAVTFKGDSKKFYLSGGALTELISDGDSDEINFSKIGVTICEKVTTKKKHDFRPIRIKQL